MTEYCFVSLEEPYFMVKFYILPSFKCSLSYSKFNFVFKVFTILNTQKDVTSQLIEQYFPFLSKFSEIAVIFISFENHDNETFFCGLSIQTCFENRIKLSEQYS